MHDTNNVTDMISMDSLPRLPMDIFLEILDWLELTPFERHHTLQLLRLTSRAFNQLATPVLFGDFKNFHLGDCYEDVEPRIGTLSKAPNSLRQRITGLRLPMNILIPRTILKQALTEDEYGESVLAIMTRNLNKQMSILLDIFVPNFRFKRTIIGGFSNLVFEGLYQNYDLLFPATRSHLLELVSRWMTNPRFGRLVKFDATFYCPDMWNLLRHFIGNPSLEKRVTNVVQSIHWKNDELPEFLQHTTSFKFRFPFTSGQPGPTGGESLAIGELLRRSQAPNLHLIYDRAYRSGFLPFFHWIEGEINLPQLTSLRIDSCCVPEMSDFLKTISKAPNLQSLVLTGVEICGTWSYFWGYKEWNVIFDHICQSLKHLVHVNFQNLGYFSRINNRDFEEEKEKQRDYPRPLFTHSLMDIVALQALLRTVEARRAIKGLKEDHWISVYCRERGALQIYKGTSRIGGEMVLNVRDWVVWRNVNIDGELED